MLHPPPSRPPEPGPPAGTPAPARPRGPRRLRPAWQGLLPLALATLLSLVSSAAASAASVSGFVSNAEDGEPLDRANVFLRGTRFGDMTNEKGFYVISGIPAGRHEIVFSYIGFHEEIRTIELAEEEAASLSVEIRPGAIRLETVEVRGEPGGRVLEPGKLTLESRQLARVPMVGEADLFRAIQALPGVSTLSDFSSGLYVRGGSPDQNLILLDDVDVYNPNHMFGFFSTFNVDAVKTVELQKSGFPSRYGGRLSSLLDVHNREGNRKEFEGTARAGLVGSSLTLEGPWRRGSWMLSGRRTYLDLLAGAAGIDLPYYFYDLHGRINYDAGPEDRTNASLFRSRDRLDWDQEGLDVLLAWGNLTGSVEWTHVFNRTVFSRFLVGMSRFRSRATVAFQDFAIDMHNRIDDVSFKGGLSWQPHPDHLLEAGMETKLLGFSWRQDIGEGERLRFSYDGTYLAWYLQDSWNYSKHWQVQPGLRLDLYNKSHTPGLGPRLAVRRLINPMLSAHAAVGRYYQYLNLVSQEGVSFADMWFPVDRTLDPGRADHYVLGVDVGPYEGFSLILEGYFKDYRNVVEFDREWSRSLFEEDSRMADVFNSGTGKAFGAEAYLRTRGLGFDGWLGYSWGVSRRTIPGYNDGREYPPTYDRRHQVVVMQNRSLGNRWSISVNFRYGSGQPTTLGAGRYAVRDITGREYEAVLPGELNAARLPDFHRLDVGFTYRTSLWGWEVEPSLELINVYNQRNVYIRTYDTTKNPAEYRDVTMLPFLPTLNVNVRF